MVAEHIRIHKPVLIAVITITTFFLIDNLRYGFRWVEAYNQLGEINLKVLTWKLTQVPLCVAAVLLTYRFSLKDALHELGLWESITRGLGMSFLVTLPALTALVFVGNLNPELTATRLLVTGFASPLSEEILFRGYLFLQLNRRANWPFAAAVLMNAVPFALGHLYQTEEFSFSGVIGVLLVMSLIAAFATWLFLRWENLWFLIGLHAFMNLWWEILAEGDTPLYGWVGNGMRFGTGALVILLTLYKDRIWKPSSIESLGGTSK